MTMRDNLQALLAAGRDSALLRFSLGECCYKDGDLTLAIGHLEAAVTQDPNYSAAWKLYGRALADDGQPARALVVLEQGIAVAEARGDNQAAREMQVFARRARKAADTAG